MPKQNIIIDSLNKSFTLLKKHKKIILALLLLQVIFLSLMISLQMFYQMKSFEAAEEIMAYLGQQDLSDINVAKNIAMGTSLLGDDPLMIYRNYRKIAGFMIRLISYSIIGYLVFGSLSWALTHQSINKAGKKEFWSYIRKFCLLALSFLVMLLLLGYLGLKGVVSGFLSETGVSAGNFIFLIMGIILFYFMFISFVLIPKVKFNDVVKKTVMLGAKKAHIMLPVCLINLAVIALFTYLVNLLSEKNILLLLLGLILWVLSFVWARIFFVLVVDKLKV